MNEKIIDSTTNAAVQLSNTGEHGFIFFAIVIVTMLFIFMGWIAYRSISEIMKNHNENVTRIDEAHERIHILETRESDCLKNVDKITKELKQCIAELKR